LSDGHGHTFTATSGHTSVDVHTWDLAALTIVAPDDANFQLNATAMDILGRTATLATPISVTVDPLAPTLAPVAAAGVEGTAIALNLGVAINSRAGDTNSLASLMVSAIPVGATLSDGTHSFKATSGNTSVDVHAWNLSSLTIAPANDANFTLTATATEKDAEGDTSVAATATELVIVKPAAPVITKFSPDTGVQGDGITSGDSTHAITLAGTADPGTKVILYDGGAPISTTTAAPDGSWSVTTPTLADGKHSFTATATDSEGDTSAPPAALAVTIDTTPPKLTTVADQTDKATSPAGAQAFFAALATDLVDGTDPVVFTDGSTVVHSGDTFAVGNHTITATATDAAGNTASETFTVDVLPGGPPPPVFNLAAADQVGTAASPEAYAGGVELVGQTGAGDTVMLLSGTSVLATTTASYTGAFTFDNVAIAAGGNALTAQSTDAAGQSTGYSLTIEGVTPPAQPNLVLQWNETTLKAIALDADPPTVASRSLAMESLAVYDAISAIDGTPGYLLNMTAPADASPNAAAAAAADTILDSLYPAQAASFDAQLAAELAAIPNGQGKTDGVNFGKAVANAIIALRANDGSNINTTDLGGTGMGVWQPTPPSYAPALDPQWANVTPFALTGPGQFLPGPPPALDSQLYANDVALTESLGQADSTTRTAQETSIAKFWNDQAGTYTPPGQWNAIADAVAQQQGDSAAADAQLFAELNVAEADAAIAAWNSKYTYNGWRPVTAIRNADSIGNPYGITQDPNWISLITTPPFPEYVAGHPTFSAAAAQVLDNFFGNNVTFNATSESLPGTTFTYAPPTSTAMTLPDGTVVNVNSSFDVAAVEAGENRIYGGIHFPFSVNAGLALGTQVGDQTLAAFSTTQDSVPPKIVINQATGLVANEDPTITGEVVTNFGVASLTVVLDGGTPITVMVNSDGTFSLPITLPLDGSGDGAHTLAFTATDQDGLQGTQSFSFDLATKPPQITLASNSMQNGATLAAGATITGTVAPEAGDSIVAFSYAFDGGAAMPIGFDPTTGAFDQALNLTDLALGNHTLVLTAMDAAGNKATDTLSASLLTEPTLTIASLTPMAMATDVGVTYRPEITFSRPVNPSTLTTSSFYATDSTGIVQAATIVPITDSAGNTTGAWLLFNNPLPGASTVTLHVAATSSRARTVHCSMPSAAVRPAAPSQRLSAR
jgi:hypothetical protein